MGIERDMRQLGLLLLNDNLLADRLILVHIQIEDKHLAVRGAGRKHRRRVRSPGRIAHRTAQIIREERVSNKT